MWTWISRFVCPGICSFCQESTGSNLDLCQFCVEDLPVAEKSCPGCAIPLVTRTGNTHLCGACTLRHPPLRRTIARCLYRYPANHLVHRLKFNDELRHARTMGLLLAEAARCCCHDIDRLIAIPMPHRRYLSRGFNHADEIARFTGRELGLPVCRESLQRRHQRDPTMQSELGRDERRHNIRGAFECRVDLRGLRVAIVDDVMTTGATVFEAASVLQQAGAESVDAWVFARTP